MMTALLLGFLSIGPVKSCCPTMNAFIADPAFAATHMAPLPFKFQSAEGKDVMATPGGVDAHGYYVAPATGNHVAILMVHEYWGLNDYIKQSAVKLHDATGYGVFAVDLYAGKIATTPEVAGQLMAAVKSEEAVAIVKGAIDALADGTFGPKPESIGTIGWCFGGGYSLQAAIQGGSKVKACVMYYGMPDDDQAHLAELHAPVLLIEALQDKWISPKVVGEFKTAMKDAHKKLRVLTYDADHAFANPSNPHYQLYPANDAMRHALAFFKANL